ncbi:MAG: NUDIX domain-containing protein [Candidatus Andersenbacteria bacterium]
MEYVDALTSLGKETGEKVSKKEAHEKGVWHRTIHIWIVNSNGEILIQKRAPGKDVNPNKWGVSSIGGHISFGDDAVVTAIREAKEELDLDIEASDLEYLYSTPHQMADKEGGLNVRHIDESFLVKEEVELDKLVLQKEEVSDVKLIHFKELEAAINQSNLGFSQHEEYPKLFKTLSQMF